MSRKAAHDYPYRLRVEHPERAELRLWRAGRPVVFDPATPPPDDAVVVLTGPAPDRLRGTAEAVEAGRRPTVLASEGVHAWLGRLGALEGGSGPTTVDGVRFEPRPYAPPPPAMGPLGRQLLARVGAIRPGAGLRALRERARAPEDAPLAWRLTFPDGSALLHLDLALHRGTPEAWVDEAATAWAGAEWLLLGAGYGEGDGVERWVGRFGAKRVLLCDLVNGERRALGLPVELVTPLRDRLVAQGLEAHVFATEASYRFE